MLVTPPAPVRALERLLRRADAALALGAARNAAGGLAVWHARRLDDARTLRDLARLEPAVPATAEPRR